MNFQEDLLIHGDSVYDIIDKQDHQAVQSEMSRPPTAAGHDDTRIFLCRMNVSRNARRQMRFGDQKVIINKILLQSIIRIFSSSITHILWRLMKSNSDIFLLRVISRYLPFLYHLKQVPREISH